MKFGTEPNNELTQKYERVKVQNDIYMSPHIYKQICPILNSTPMYKCLACFTRLPIIPLSNIQKKKFQLVNFVFPM